jgi:hypothetical protein
VLHLAGEVELLAEVVQERQLRLEVVDVVLLVGEDLLEQPLAGVVADLVAVGDGRAQPVDDLDLDRHVRLELLADGLAHAEREQPLVVGQALEEEDAVGQPLRVGHLLDRLGTGVRRELRVAPVLLHLRVQEVLVDGGQLAGELLVEQLDHAGVTLHGSSSVRVAPRLAAHATAEMSRPCRGSAARSRSQIRSRQLPQPVPAPQASPTSSSVRAPSSITSASWDSLTAKQMQTYTGNAPEVRVGKALLS